MSSAVAIEIVYVLRVRLHNYSVYAHIPFLAVVGSITPLIYSIDPSKPYFLNHKPARPPTSLLLACSDRQHLFTSPLVQPQILSTAFAVFTTYPPLTIKQVHFK